MAQDAKEGAGTSQGTLNSKNRKWTVRLESNKASNPQCNQCGRKYRGLSLVGQNRCYVPYSQFSLPDHLIVSTPGDKIIVAKRNVEIHDKKLLGDLIILYAKDFCFDP